MRLKLVFSVIALGCVPFVAMGANAQRGKGMSAKQTAQCKAILANEAKALGVDANDPQLVQKIERHQNELGSQGSSQVRQCLEWTSVTCTMCWSNPSYYCQGETEITCGMTCGSEGRSSPCQ